MALLLETTLGDLVIDLDVEGSPALARNVLKLAKARYYTSSLVYNVQPHRFCQWGDPRGDGTGGACIYSLLDSHEKDVTKSKARFLKSIGRILSPQECRQRGIVVATEMNGIPNTIGSQFLITLEEGQGRALDGYIPPHAHDNEQTQPPKYLSLGVVTEDTNNVLQKVHDAYCDASGRPYADIRIERALVIHDPFPDPPELHQLMKQRGVEINSDQDVTASPSYERPPEELVEIRISANQVEEEGEDDEQDMERARLREEEIAKKEDKSRAVVLEMLGDLPSADIKAPENVLFLCKLNSITEDEDLELIFSRFDPNVKVEIIRDHDTGASLGYAFAEFTTKQKCVEAYFKMNGALVDDRRIKVDFSQSVAKIWDRYNQKLKPQQLGPDAFGGGRGGGQSANRGRRGRGGGARGSFDGSSRQNGRGESHQHRNDGNLHGGGGPSAREDRSRYDAPPTRRDDYRNGDRGHHYRTDRDHFREERRHRHDEYSPRREYDDFGRKRRSRSPSPDADRSRDDKRRKHSRKHHRRERSRSDDDDGRRRYERSTRRYDSDDDGLGSRNREEGEDSRSRRREDEDDSRSRHRDGPDDERRHRKKHHRHHRDRDECRSRDDDKHRDDQKHKKRKHKEKRRRSRSRSAS